MRPTSFLWLLSSALLVNAVPVLVRFVRSGPFTILKLGQSLQVDSSGLANVNESDSFVDPANVDRRRRDLDEASRSPPT